MSKIQVRGSIALIVLTLWLPVDVAGASPEMRLDQSVDAPVDVGAAINEGCRYVAQTYTAGTTGLLRAVAIDVLSASEYDLRIQIRDVREGAPTRWIWTSETLCTPDAMLSDRQYLDWPAPQIAGHQYAIVVEYPSAPPAGANQWQGTWQGASGDTYTGGDMFCSNDGRTWTASASGFDLRFQTFVSPLWLPHAH